jgi:hypothetical protein
MYIIIIIPKPPLPSPYRLSPVAYRLRRGTGIFPKLSPRGTTTLSSFRPPLPPKSTFSPLPTGFFIFPPMGTGIERLVTDGMDSILATVGNTTSGLGGVDIPDPSSSSCSCSPETLRRRKASSNASLGSVLSHDCGTFQAFFLGVIPVGTSSRIPDDKKVEVEARTDFTLLLDSAYVWSNFSDAVAC